MTTRDSAAMPTGHVSPPHAIADRGALAVLILTVVLFVAPMRLWLKFHPVLPAGLAPGFEMRALVWSALLALLLPLIQIFAEIRQLGGGVIRGNRADYPAVTGFAARVGRAHRNLIEALAPFAVVVVAARLQGVSDPTTVAAAAAFVAARTVHAVSYAAGVPVLRSAAYYGGLVATTAIVIDLPLL